MTRTIMCRKYHEELPALGFGDDQLGDDLAGVVRGDLEFVQVGAVALIDQRRLGAFGLVLLSVMMSGALLSAGTCANQERFGAQALAGPDWRGRLG